MADKPKRQKKQKAPTSIAKKRHYLSIATFIFAVLVISATIWFIWKSQRDVNASANGDLGSSVRIDTIDAAMLDSTIKKNNARVSTERTTPETIANPFKKPVVIPPTPVAPTATAPTTVTPETIQVAQ